jgi:cyclohexyl-isocyanide hydratase
LLGATPVADRVVKDRNRMTGGGVTAGVDFALALVAELYGVEEAKCIQLNLEYDPQPPFKAGSPERASRAMVDKTMQKFAERQARRLAATKSAAARLK